MKKIFFQTLVFLFTFTIEVRVHAIVQSVPVSDCADQCSLVNSEQIDFYNEEKLSLLMFKDSQIQKYDTEKWALVKGAVEIKLEKEITLETLFANVQLSPGIYYFEQSSQLLKISTYAGLAKFQPLGNTQTVELKTGMMTQLRSVTKEGYSQMLIPQMVSWSEMAKGISFFFRENRSELKSVLKTLLVTWEEQRNVVSSLHRDIASYEIQAEKDRREQYSRQRAEWAKEREWLRNKLWQKTLE